jgi:hypothetical protein
MLADSTLIANLTNQLLLLLLLSGFFNQNEGDSINNIVLPGRKECFIIDYDSVSSINTSKYAKAYVVTEVKLKTKNQALRVAAYADRKTLFLFRDYFGRYIKPHDQCSLPLEHSSLETHPSLLVLILSRLYLTLWMISLLMEK